MSQAQRVYHVILPRQAADRYEAQTTNGKIATRITLAVLAILREEDSKVERKDISTAWVK